MPHERRSADGAGSHRFDRRIRGVHCWADEAMTGDVLGYAVSVVIALLVLAYLVAAMLLPEKF
jgi:F subunit of K+-transporting ATPase (Potass_KdpF)